MRNKLYSEFKNYFRCALLDARAKKNCTQEEMAALLEMSPRAYANLESGKSCCNTITFLLFLRRACPHPFAFLVTLFRRMDDIMKADG